MASISVRHQHASFPSPTGDIRVREVLKGIRRTIGTATDEAAPATIGDIRAMIAHAGQNLTAVRDRALLLIGFAGAMRRSELTALDVADLERRDEGMALTLRRSKTDQEGAGRKVALPYGSDPRTCPVRALDDWLTATDITDGPIFRPINRHGQVQPTRLSGQSVSLIVKRLAASAQMDSQRYSGHSLRAGFATSAAAAGATEAAIANQTGHRSMEILRRYVRHGNLFTDNAVTRLGL